jgi:hypothetical protein
MAGLIKRITFQSLVPLTSRLSRTLEVFEGRKHFKGKRIVLIGPSAIIDESLIRRVSQADALVVVNKGHRLASFLELKKYARELVLFHCLDRSEETGGGGFGSFELRRKGFRAVCFPFFEKRFADNIVEFHKINVALLPLRRISLECYAELQASIAGFTPNTGFAAVWMIAKCECASLYVSGMNFMRLPYTREYEPALDSQTKMVDLIEKFGNHNPDLDLKSFIQLVNSYPIETDSVLSEIISRPIVPIFYQKMTLLSTPYVKDTGLEPV